MVVLECPVRRCVSVSVSVHRVGVGRREEKGICAVWMEREMKNYMDGNFDAELYFNL